MFPLAHYGDVILEDRAAGAQRKRQIAASVRRRRTSHRRNVLRRLAAGPAGLLSLVRNRPRVLPQ